jgi:hypothetical protein
MPDLVYRIKETLTVNGKVVGMMSRIQSLVSIVITKPSYNVPVSAPINLLAFAATESFGAIADASLRYLRITNLGGLPLLCDVTFTIGTDTVVTKISGGNSLS